jgi:peptidyl-dipeptidase Dcp
MTTIRDQEKLRGDIRPLVINVMNFSKPEPGQAYDSFRQYGFGGHDDALSIPDVGYPTLCLFLRWTTNSTVFMG